MSQDVKVYIHVCFETSNNMTTLHLAARQAFTLLIKTSMSSKAHCGEDANIYNIEKQKTQNIQTYKH